MLSERACIVNVHGFFVPAYHWQTCREAEVALWETFKACERITRCVPRLSKDKGALLRDGVAGGRAQ